MKADMHTHSQFSHDSICVIEEMCLFQMQRGTKIFAVTDHCDIASFCQYDVFAPIKEALEEVVALKKRYDGRCLILSGVEIGEGFWFPEQCKKIHDLALYDVIIGSVHCVKCKDLEMAYSRIDFSLLDREKIYKYLDCYFRDMITMLQTEDFDILAHLTCPLRYIEGKYGIQLDLKRFEEKISTILKTVVERKIALEINTSSYDTLHDFMPGREIIEKYYRMGGRLVTLGSDAHIAEHASYKFENVVQALKEVGFENICYYQNRNRKEISLYGGSK